MATKTKSAPKTVIRPLGDRVLVQRMEAEDKTAGGILLPESAKEKPKEGKVIAVGEGKLLDNGSRAALQVKEQDRVIFSSYAGTEIKVEGEDYLILDESDILAVVEAAGGEAADIVRLTWYVKGKRAYLARQTEVGAAYRKMLGRHFPAMTMVVVKDLIEDEALLEIEATAFIGQSSNPDRPHD